MKHRMTVWAYRDKVADWVNYVLRSQVCDFSNVVNVNEPSSDFPIYGREINGADFASGPVICDTSFTCGRRALIGVHKNLSHCAFCEYLPLRFAYLVRKY